MARLAGDNVAPLRRSSAVWMPAKIGRLSAGVDAGITVPKLSLVKGLVKGSKQERNTLLLKGPELR